ncbi:MAG: glycosyltransferase family 39 protein [Myxococcota bacterium]
MTALIGPLLAKNPYDAWFFANITYGTLTVLAAYALGAALTNRRRTGLITAALFAFWPQHIRFSASEATHIAFVLWATTALALAALAARTGRLRTFAALVATTAAAVITRPEAALFVPACALLAIAHGPGVRTRLLSPPRIALVVLAAWLLLPTVLTIAGAPAPSTSTRPPSTPSPSTSTASPASPQPSSSPPAATPSSTSPPPPPGSGP